MSRTNKASDGAETALVVVPQNDASTALKDPETAALIAAYLGIKSSDKRAFLEWFVHALADDD